MNILYIEHYAGSPEMGMEFRPYYLSREWVKMGHKVTIIAGDFSHLRKKNPIVTKDFQTEIIDDIEYVWLKTGKYEGNGSARAITMERFVRKLYTNARMISNKWKPNVVIASSTYPLDAYPARKIANHAKAKYIHEVHDMWPATLYEVGGMSKKHPFVMIMQTAENYAYKHCDKCIALLPYSKEYMIDHGLDSDKWVNIQNGVVEEEWEKPEDIPEEHRRFFSEHVGKFIIGYFGGHAFSNNLGNILDVAKIMKEETDIIFVLVGNGVEKDSLIEKAKKENICNAFFLPPVNKKSIPRLVGFFDVSIMTGHSSPLYKYGLCMNKMYDSMMAGKPIICAISAPRSLVEEYECGIQVASDDTEGIIKAIQTIKEMPKEERELMGENGQNAVINHFTYRILAEEFLSEIQEM